jgi:molybdate transport system regulatory protein
MEPQIKIWVEEGGRTVFGDQEVRLLEAIAARGTLAEVAASLGMSYRGLWGKLREMEANLGTKLVQTTVGGSGGGRSELTEVAQSLVALYSSFRGAVGDYAVRRFEPCSAFLDTRCSETEATQRSAGGAAEAASAGAWGSSPVSIPA